MQIYFSQVPTEFLEDDDNFEFEGKQYYYCMEVNEEEFKVSDNCGRYMPFNKDSLGALYRAIIVADHKYAALITVESNLDNAADAYNEAFASINSAENEICV